MTLRVAFRMADRSRFWDRIIDDFTGQRGIVHAEILFNDCSSFSSDAPEGVRFLDRLDMYSNPDGWSVIETPWVSDSNVRDWALSIVGNPYDYLGATCSAARMDVLKLHVEGRWWCSQVCLEYLSRCPGGPLGINPSINPADLYDVLLHVVNGASTDRLAAALPYQIAECDDDIPYEVLMAVEQAEAHFQGTKT